MKNKKFQLKAIHIIFAVFIVVILICVNLWYAICSDSDIKSDILAVIGGWISGISTILLGLIAIRQTANYSDLSDEFFTKQAGVLSNIEKISKAQQDLIWRSKHYDFFALYIRNLEEFRNKFAKISSDKLNVHYVLNLSSNLALEQMEQEVLADNEITRLSAEFSVFLFSSIFYINGQSELNNLSIQYCDFAKAVRWEFIHAETNATNVDYRNQKIAVLYEKYTEFITELQSYILRAKMFALKLIDEDIEHDVLVRELQNMRKLQIKFIEDNRCTQEDNDGQNEI